MTAAVFSPDLVMHLMQVDGQALREAQEETMGREAKADKVEGPAQEEAGEEAASNSA